MDQETMNRLTDAEFKIMEVLWREGDCPAKHISDVMSEKNGWNINSTYTLIKRCIAKGMIARSEPGFVCHALVSCEDVRRVETEKLIDRVFDGSLDLLFTALLGSKKLSQKQVRELQLRLAELEGEEDV